MCGPMSAGEFPRRTSFWRDFPEHSFSPTIQDFGPLTGAHFCCMIDELQHDIATTPGPQRTGFRPCQGFLILLLYSILNIF